jgi:hypothetical protein
LEPETDFKFFTALSPDVAAYLKAKIDGQPSPVFGSAQARPRPASSPRIDWLLIALDVGLFVHIVSILICVMIFRLSRKK